MEYEATETGKKRAAVAVQGGRERGGSNGALRYETGAHERTGMTALALALARPTTTVQRQRNETERNVRGEAASDSGAPSRTQAPE